jgi:5-methylcytosine-specific restriction endonuclease McrBC regulatory subunit McrC
MGSLVPDCILQGRDRAVLVDAKYKRHMDQLSRYGWAGLNEAVREAHRADIHQALAYANLAAVSTIDTILAYPTNRAETPLAMCTIPAGRSRLRLHLIGLPFGFEKPYARTQAIEHWMLQLAT